MPRGPRLHRAAWLFWSSLSIATSLPLRLVAETRAQTRQGQGSLATGSAPPYRFDLGKPPANGHFELQSTGSSEWPYERAKWRRRLLSSSARHAADLKKMQHDDKDSFLWGELSDFKEDDSSSYWNDLCNGTNVTNNNTLPGDVDVSDLNITVVLSSWKLANDSVCSEVVGENYSDPLEAFKKCGGTCDGLSGESCTSNSSTTASNSSTSNSITSCKKIRLCKLGGTRKKANSSLVFNKPADFASPKGLPRPPIELGFWRDFCNYRKKGRLLRIMYEGKNCQESKVKALGEAPNPVECAAKAAKDATCTSVFDFRFGPPTVCRCLQINQDCAPEVATGGHVYAPTVE